jgi:DSF synthase
MTYFSVPSHIPETTDITVAPSASEMFTQFFTRYDPVTGAIWCFMQPKPRPCVNPTFLAELMRLQQQLKRSYQNKAHNTIWPFHYLILASNVPGVFSLGGDLQLFKQLIQEKDKNRLLAYAHRCVDLLYTNITNLDLPITMIALVQGQALGGGFETALSCDVVIAERSAQMGLPEVLFNLFPGMGAYNLLAGRLDPVRAEKMILSGRTYSAEELYDMGIVDILADDGEGVKATEQYLTRHGQMQNAYHAIQKVRRITNPISYDSLVEIVNVWVEAALRLNRRDLFKMERLLYAQKLLGKKKSSSETKIVRLRSHNDWRKTEDSKLAFPLVNHLGQLVLNDRRKRDERRTQ